METLGWASAVGLVLAVAPATASAQVYKCIEGGRTAFTDVPCPDGNGGSVKVAVASPQSDVKFDIQTKHYPVAGQTFRDAFRYMTSGQNGWGAWAPWHVQYEFDTKPRSTGCRIERLRIRMVGEITMPKWNYYDTASLADQTAWTGMYSRLKVHEDGHLQNGREFAVLLRERLLGLGEVPCGEVRKRAHDTYTQLYERLKERDAEYDRRTDHGLRQDNPR